MCRDDDHRFELRLKECGVFRTGSLHMILLSHCFYAGGIIPRVQIDCKGTRVYSKSILSPKLRVYSENYPFYYHQ